MLADALWRLGADFGVVVVVDAGPRTRSAAERWSRNTFRFSKEYEYRTS